MKKQRQSFSIETNSAIRLLNRELRGHFKEKKRIEIRKIVNGSSSGLWKAVNRAKNLNFEQIPADMTMDGHKVQTNSRAQCFAEYFCGKVFCHFNKSIVKNDIYNGKCKLVVANRDFMTRWDVWECMSQLKNKKCEGYDRIHSSLIKT